jgi:glycosyl transferase family 2/uncharacterized protein DUF3473
MYFHIWELDPKLPKISSASWMSRIRMYRNNARMKDVYGELFQHYRFQGIARHLDLSPGKRDIAINHTAPGCRPLEPGNVSPYGFDNHSTGSEKTPPGPDTRRQENQEETERSWVTIVIPCYNEELVLPYLSNTLQELEQQLVQFWKLRFLFVDDGSTDNTWEALQHLFGERHNYTMISHEKNRGVAAAILTGLQNADTEIVCSIDCDCTYDPHQLEVMIPMLKDDVALVTASPYHPLGQVLNVPFWRLFLSKGLSSIYRHLLHHKLATYTSCFRVYRRSALMGVVLKKNNFLGILETLAWLDIKGKKIVECPAVLEVRIFGASKMKTINTIFGHLGLISRIFVLKMIDKKTVKRIKHWISNMVHT